MFSVDGFQWDISCDISRVSEVKASEISGMLLNKEYFNDVLGTYLRYEITLAVPIRAGTKYAAVYERLTEPKGGHEFRLPYNQGMITFTGRVETVSDVYVQLPNGRQYWKGTRVAVLANHPSKTVTLEEAIAYGGAPLVPEVTTVSIGDLYEYTADGWVAAEYEDADVKRY